MQLEFQSKLIADREDIWRWATSLDGILAEMRPWMRMTAPAGVRSLDDIQITPGERLFRSRLYLFGFLPWGYSDLTLLEWTPGVGFVEQSPMTGMNVWRHERTIVPAAKRSGTGPSPAPPGCTLTDRLTFEPRLFPSLVTWFIRRLFAHRHAVLRRRFGRAE